MQKLIRVHAPVIPSSMHNDCTPSCPFPLPFAQTQSTFATVMDHRSIPLTAQDICIALSIGSSCVNAPKISDLTQNGKCAIGHIWLTVNRKRRHLRPQQRRRGRQAEYLPPQGQSQRHHQNLEFKKHGMAGHGMAGHGIIEAWLTGPFILALSYFSPARNNDAV